MKIAFIGLGNMGMPMAQNLLEAGHRLIVYNRTSEKARPLLDQGAQLAVTPSAAAKESEMVMTMLADDAALENVVFGADGILNGMPENGIHISASTISVALSQRLEEAHREKGLHFVSATVMGRPDAAKAAKLRVLLAGSDIATSRAIPVLEPLSQQIIRVGDEGSKGNLVKIGTNFLIASMLESLSEAQALVERHGVDPEVFMEVVNAVFQSPLYLNYGGMMTERRFDPAGFKMTLGLKDVELALSAALSVDASLPLGKLIQGNFREEIARGNGSLDWTALLLHFINEHGR